MNTFLIISISTIFLTQIYMLIVINSAFKFTNKQNEEFIYNQGELMKAANQIFEKQKRYWAIANGDDLKPDWDSELEGKYL